jgi:hypothetical protein
LEDVRGKPRQAPRRRRPGSGGADAAGRHGLAVVTAALARMLGARAAADRAGTRADADGRGRIQFLLAFGRGTGAARSVHLRRIVFVHGTSPVEWKGLALCHQM